MFRCDHCRRSLGLIVHRYWRMRFCSAACVERYKQRLQTETKANISRSLGRLSCRDVYPATTINYSIFTTQ